MPRALRNSTKLRLDGSTVVDTNRSSGSAANPRRSPRVSGKTSDGNTVAPPASAKRTGEELYENSSKKKGKKDSPSSPNAAAPPSENGLAAVEGDQDRSSNTVICPAAENGSGSGAPQGARVEKDKEEEQAVGETVGEPAAGRSNARRETWAKVARVRGAHFARPDRKPSPAATARGGSKGRDRGGAVTGRIENEGPKESWPGPWSEARRLMEEREKAATRRESIRTNGIAEAEEGSDDDNDDEEDRHPPTVKLEWKPRGRGSTAGKSRGVLTLFRLCLDLLAENFDHVESLGDVSAEIRNHLAGVLCQELKLTTEALRRLSEPGVTELILPDCSRIEPDQMRDSLLQCRSTLRVLRLGTCGRCVGDATVEALATAGGLPRLEIAALSGTYRLTDAGVLKLLACSPRLTGLEIPANSRISRKSLDTMVDAERPVGRALTSLSLMDCIHLGPEALEPLRRMACLESLSLSGVAKLTDEALVQALRAHGWKLRHLDISDCPLVTDVSLKAVGECCDVLESFSLGMCPLLTTGAIQELFQYSGSSADVASSNSAAATVPEPSWRTKGGVGGKGKGKSNAKGKGKAAGAADANVTLNEDDDGEENAFDEGESDPAGRGSSPPSTIASSANGGGARVGGIGHAMLKSRLTKVSLRGMTKVDDNAVMAIAAACSDGLRDLDLKGVTSITDNSLASLARFCSSSLESVDLSFCRRVTDDGLGHLVDASPKMRSMRLWGCTQVGERFLKGHSREELVISRY